MLQESVAAAEVLIRDRMVEVQKAVRERDPGWSDDPSDRMMRGRECGGGLGVILGVTSAKAAGGVFSAEERTECMVDLHTLHGTEGADVVANFLAEVSTHPISMVIGADCPSWNGKTSVDSLTSLWVKRNTSLPKTHCAAHPKFVSGRASSSSWWNGVIHGTKVEGSSA